MSLKTAVNRNGHPPKRRKLSHDSNDTEDSIEREAEADDVQMPDPHDNGQISEEEEDDESPPDLSETSRSHPKGSRSNISASTTVSLSAPGTSVLGMQIHDLLEEVTPNYDSLLRKFQPHVDWIRTTLSSLPSSPAASLREATGELYAVGVCVPFPQPRPPKDAQYKFGFRSPEQIELRGSIARKLSLKGDGEICLQVTMPEDLLQEKDYLDYRAFYKRAYYLAKLAAGLKAAAGSKYDVEFVRENELELLACLVVKPKADSEAATVSKSHPIRITVCLPEDYFPHAKTSPSRSCVRRQDSDQAPPDIAKATPFYNACLQELCSQTYIEELLSKSSHKCPAFLEASRLGQIWLRQRRLDSTLSGGGFGQLEWAVTCALLLHGGGHRDRPLLSERYSTLQLFKAMLQVLSEKDFLSPMIIPAVSEMHLGISEIPVLYDSTGGYNVLNKMTPSLYALLRHHARLSLSALNAKTDHGFDTTFITRVSSPLVQFDEVYTVPFLKHAHSADQLQNITQVHQVLQRACSDRTTLITVRSGAPGTWALKQGAPPGRDIKFYIYLLVNPETTGRLVDHGPSAEQPDAAAEFRKFWGEKSELRRFKDGVICESLLWSKETPVTQQILKYVFGFHFGRNPAGLVCHTPELEGMLQPTVALTAADAFNAINKAYQALTSTLHQLENMPLPVRSVAPTGVALRNASLKHPLQPSGSTPIDILVQFESSARWPDSLPAIQYTKIAFLTKLADLLSDNDKSITTRIGLENTASSVDGYFNTSYLDIIYSSPAPTLAPICFRLRIHHDREAHLLQSALSNKSLHGSARETLGLALSTYKRTFVASSIHATTIRSLCTRFPALSSTIRLLKKWLSSHLLLRHVPQEVIELIASHVFLHPSPWSTPDTATTAFLRCLHVLSHWDYVSQPLIIDVSQTQDMTAQTHDDLRTRFTAWRKLDPALNNVIWFVGTNIDSTGTVWTQNAQPPRVVAARVQALATAAIDTVKQKDLDMQKYHWSDLFVSPMEDFDFRTELKKDVVGYQTGDKWISGGITQAEKKFKNLEVQEEMDTDRIGHDPVGLYIQDLEHVFGDVALFCYDEDFRLQWDGGRLRPAVIAGLWKPIVRGRKEWRVRMGYSTKPSGNETAGDEVEANFRGMLNEMARLGDGLVERVDG